MYNRCSFLWIILSPFATLLADDSNLSSSLTFDRASINRYSLNHLPRSLSLRQGDDVWLGYDLERGKLYKIWKAPAGESGLITSGFTTKSNGTSWYEDKSEASWTFSFRGDSSPMEIRYLGISQRDNYVELRWELKRGHRRLKLTERIPLQVSGEVRGERQVRAELLEKGESILPPSRTDKLWTLLDEQGRLSDGIHSSNWYRWVLR